MDRLCVIPGRTKCEPGTSPAAVLANKPAERVGGKMPARAPGPHQQRGKLAHGCVTTTFQHGQTQGFSADYEHFSAGGVSVVPLDPNPARTQAARRALRQALLNEQPADLLSDGMRGFATNAQYAEARAQMRVYAEHADEFVYLRSDPPDGESERHIYKVTLAGETTYIAFVWRQGLVVGMQRMDE